MKRNKGYLFDGSPITNKLMRLIIGLFFLMSPFFSFAQNYPLPEPGRGDNQLELEKQLRKAPSPAEKANAYVALAGFFFQKPLKKKEDIQKSLMYCDRALSLSKVSGNALAYNNALMLSAHCHLVLKDFDAVETILKRPLPKRDRLNLMLSTSFCFWASQTLDSSYDQKSLLYAKSARALARQMSDRPGELSALKNIALAQTAHQPDFAEKGLLDVLSGYKTANNRLLQYPYFYLAWFYDQTDQPDLASDYALNALASMKANGDYSIAGDLYLLYAVICTKNDQYQDGLVYAFRAIAAYQKSAGLHDLSSPYLTLVVTRAYQKLRRHNQAMSYMLKMMRRYPPQNTRDSMSYLSMIGHGYRELKEYDKAIPYFNAFKQLSLKAHYDENAANLNFGQLYVEARRYDQALNYLDKVMKNEQKFSMGERRHLRYMMFLADSATGRYINAIRDMSFLNDQAETNRRLKTDKALKKWEVAYGTQKKEEELRLKNQNIELLNQQFTAQQEKVKQSNLIRNLSAGALFLTMIVISLLYLQYRQKQRTNLLLLEKSNHILEKNHALESLLTVKEWLLKEVHHRVKNNLHTIFCLLESQSVFLQGDALDAVETSKNRIFAISLLHQKLYQSDHIGLVDMSLYFRELLIFLQESFNYESRNIRINPAIESIPLNITFAVPLAMILNEALTNAFKYAFIGRDAGLIEIRLRKTGQQISFSITDNGIGLDNRPQRKGSMGMELMRGLSDDIGAEINFETDQGTSITVVLQLTEELHDLKTNKNHE